MNCSSGCKTRDHESYAACLASKQPQSHNSTQTVDGLYNKNVLNTLEINEYRAARAQGIQPKGTKLSDTRYAVEASRRADTALTIS